MIDLGLSKLAIIGAVALIVIGPEKLPKVARMAGSLFGRAQRYLNDVKAEVSREMELDELRKMQQDVQQAAHEVGQSIEQELQFEHSEAEPSWDAAGSPGSAPAFGHKSREFRRKKQARNAAVPGWYKSRHAQRSKVLSGAARMARHRVRRAAPASFY